MQFVYALVLAIGINASALAQPQKKCFMNAGLKDQDRIYLTINGTQVAGEFVIDRNYDSADRETFPFSGTRVGNSLNVKFTSGKSPASLPRHQSQFGWTLDTLSDRETLRVTLYGRNYATNTNEAYVVGYEPCEPGYAMLMKLAQRIAFAKGASSASRVVLLVTRTEHKAFLLNLGKGQRASVQAAGCGITLYYPDKTPHLAGTMILETVVGRGGACGCGVQGKAQRRGILNVFQGVATKPCAVRTVRSAL